MIRTTAFSLGLVAMGFATQPAGAADAPLWEGYWATKAASCAKAGEVGENTPDWYGRDGLFGLEWSCDITSVSDTGVGNSWALQLQCLDAGYEYSEAQIIMVTPDDRLLVIVETGVAANLVRCAAPKK